MLMLLTFSLLLYSTLILCEIYSCHDQLFEFCLSRFFDSINVFVVDPVKAQLLNFCLWLARGGLSQATFSLETCAFPSTPLLYPTFWEASPANRGPVLGLGSQPDLGLVQPGELAKPIGAQCQSQATGKWACRPLMVQAAAGKTPPLPTISPGPRTHVHICLHLHIFAKTTNFLPEPTDPPTVEIDQHCN